MKRIILSCLMVAACSSSKKATNTSSGGGSSSGSSSGSSNPADADNKDSIAYTGSFVDSAQAAATPSGGTPESTTIDFTDLTKHPGCSTYGRNYTVSGTTPTDITGPTATASAGIGYTNATITGYPCAAKEYRPTGTEDTSKPIVILVHGNADDPTVWENCDATDTTDGQPNIYETKYSNCQNTPTDGAVAVDMISVQLTAAGYHAYAVDLRYDLVPTDLTNSTATSPYYNAAQQFNHAWSVPIAQKMVESLYTMYPNRKFVIIGHSLGVTIARDLLRRMHRAGEKPFDRLQAFIGASGGNHGIKPGNGTPGSGAYADLCGSDPSHPINKTIRGASACELGNYDGWVVSTFERPISGPSENWETPCADGDTAFDQSGVCGSNKVAYTTLVDADADGTTHDEIVNGPSAALTGANNVLIGSDAQDHTGYFIHILPYHFASVRSKQGTDAIMAAVTK